MVHEIEVAGQRFSLAPLKPEDITEVLRLCDRCVGENLYTREELIHAMKDADSMFLVLKNPNGQLAGYIYYYLTDTEQIARDSRVKSAKISEVCKCEDRMPVGKIQSVGVEEEFRGHGLAKHLVRFALSQLGKMGAAEVFIICWNIRGVVPLGKVLKECQFTHLTTAKGIWYNKKELYCPYCKGRCKCDAEVFYKKLGVSYKSNDYERKFK